MREIRPSLVSVAIVAAILVATLAAICAVPCQSQESNLTIVIQPDRCAYSVMDTVTILVAHKYTDTLFASPHLHSHRHGSWDLIIGNLQDYWDEPKDGIYSEYSTFQPIPPGTIYQFRVSMADIAVSFPGELLLRFGVTASLFKGLPPAELGAPWESKPFMLAEPAESDYDMLRAIDRKQWKRDTVFAPYDPINHTPVIPLDVFSRRPYRLMLLDPCDTMEVGREDKTRYEILWETLSAHGSMDLVVTKRQIWLRSIQDNPNPSQLFWVTNISEVQYKAVESMLKTYRQDFEEIVPETRFSCYFYWTKYIPPEMPALTEWTEESTRSYQEDAKEKIHVNARKLIDMINSTLKEEEKIKFPSRSELDELPDVRWETLL